MRKEIHIPTNCPECDAELELINVQLFCTNKSCPAILDKKLEHFIKTLGIKGLGTKTLEKIHLQALPEIFTLTEEDISNRIGSKVLAKKIYAHIQYAKEADLEQVLPSFGIPLIGKTAAAKVCSVISSIDEISLETCKQAKLGDKATNNLLTFLETETLEDFPFSFKCSPNKKRVAIEVCITGRLNSFSNKAQATEALIELGYKVVDSVTRATSILIDETDGFSDKRKKAESYGIQVITNLNNFLIEKTNE